MVVGVGGGARRIEEAGGFGGGKVGFGVEGCPGVEFEKGGWGG